MDHKELGMGPLAWLKGVGQQAVRSIIIFLTFPTSIGKNDPYQPALFIESKSIVLRRYCFDNGNISFFLNA